MTEFLNLFADIEIIIVQIGALVFTFSYGLFFRWRRTQPGRSLMYMFMAFDLLILLNMLGRWFGPDYWGRDVLRPVIYSLLVFAIWRLVIVLWANWKRGSAILDLESRPRKKD